MKQQKNKIIVIFPYFFIREPEKEIKIDNIHIKSACVQNLDVSDESKSIQSYLSNLAKIFMYGNYVQIKNFSYTIYEYGTTKHFTTIKKRLNKLITLLRFSELCELKEGATYDHFNYFLFDILSYKEAKSSGLNKNTLYYKGMLNGESPYDFYINNDIVKTPYIAYNLMSPIEITRESTNGYISKIYYASNLFKSNELARIISSIEWFNRSFSHYGRGIDLSDAIINIHIALESLLRPTDEGSGVKAQIKTALLNLFGHSEELEKWFNAFWSLRNSIVHGDEKPKSFIYVHPKSKAKKGRSHLYIARRVFVGCINAILSLRSTTFVPGLDEELIPNEVRINESIKLIKKYNGNLKKLKKVFDYLKSLRVNDLSASKEKIEEISRLFLPIIKDDLKNLTPKHKDIREMLENYIAEILSGKKNDSELFCYYYALGINYPAYKKDYWQNFNTEQKDLRIAAHRFFEFMEKYCSYAML